ncbi:hypothetical protein PV327_000804 [Microctonus hyperodae]|uniref:Biogenesis of lysosome-related organelles complex 1 subunit 3 n=1 Tax=Microctonus hyperodae TaxID=165561 RepID=A0AA39L2I7_MICHY|nr:hypothetical protein PV327_000804 [Microctonus hyperodae]
MMRHSLPKIELISDNSESEEDSEPVFIKRSFVKLEKLNMENLNDNCESRNDQHDSFTLLECMKNIELKYQDELEKRLSLLRVSFDKTKQLLETPKSIDEIATTCDEINNHICLMSNVMCKYSAKMLHMSNALRAIQKILDDDDS